MTSMEVGMGDHELRGRESERSFRSGSKEVFYQDRTAELFFVRTYPVQNNRERRGLPVRECWRPESFENKVHLRPFHRETLHMLAFLSFAVSVQSFPIAFAPSHCLACVSRRLDH